METVYLAYRSEGVPFSKLERAMLRRFHPRRILLNVVTMMWAIYFLWNHNWVAAVTIVGIGVVSGLLATKDVDYEAMAQTTLGKLALLHLHPVNVVIQTVGLFPFFYGIWVHDATAILWGLTILFLGHWFGWGKVINA